MLRATFYFWNRTTNTFQIPHGMISPTLFKVAAITGLRPLVKSLCQTCRQQTNIGSTCQTTYSMYIKNNMGMLSSNVSNHEHVAFLFYWFNAIAFCSKSVKAQTTLLPLVAFLHEGRKLCLSKMLLARLYEEPVLLSSKWKKLKITMLAAPFWLLQLWLNAAFEAQLKYSPPTILYRDIKSTRLS